VWTIQKENSASREGVREKGRGHPCFGERGEGGYTEKKLKKGTSGKRPRKKKGCIQERKKNRGVGVALEDQKKRPIFTRGNHERSKKEGRVPTMVEKKGNLDHLKQLKGGGKARKKKTKNGGKRRSTRTPFEKYEKGDLPSGQLQQIGTSNILEIAEKKNTAKGERSQWGRKKQRAGGEGGWALPDRAETVSNPRVAEKGGGG